MTLTSSRGPKALVPPLEQNGERVRVRGLWFEYVFGFSVTVRVAVFSCLGV